LKLEFPHFVLINAVFQEPDCHSKNGAGREACWALQHPPCDQVRVLLDVARCGDHSPDDRLKEISANRASHCAGDGMAKRSEAVFLRGNRRSMPTENASDDLNYKICSRPGHRDLPLLLAFMLSRETTAIACARAEFPAQRNKTLKGFFSGIIGYRLPLFF
jgi:hypothetical protein